MSNSKLTKRYPARVYLKKAFIASIISSVLNAIVFSIGNLAGAFPEEVIISGSGQPISIAQVIFASAVGSFLGILVFWLIGKLKVFLIISITVLILSMATPFTIQGSPLLMTIFLMIMHIIAGGVTIYIAAFEKVVHRK